MIVGIGSDIARVERFTRAMKRHGPRFAERILGPDEQAIWLHKAQPAAFLAKRFAAKEAFVKALGLGLRQGLQWGDIQVLNDALGKPYFLLNGEAERLLLAAGVTASHVTLSDEAEYAVAFVVLER
ncbi:MULTISPECIES: holo-ACP synthase [Halomonadaceae]|jgi:holo-[acyl-carrier protein] synthase|uniref:Holo-[acyl-carrier-protein] synthase n=1 Tax=Vreelandella titanicae TaxID=664683 RepID=A0A653Q9F9_9GAMM|nr:MULTISPECIES: holo-ACP synthase [Halomonas]QKS23125.1 Holo-[acyl-carrier-protein] synthase [Halomonas titanicae]CAD5262140.1 holo-(acyl-carrier-protein) synthase 1 [Halomonas sp. 156]CAD5286706.1 holo-(acyl-carrier-protein) synthase 1 [Halomonas sp. 113]CAD5288297.1 holo-(acyl-carrier-protein) synthase 1 [Halomonas sp. 59]CAD5290857.1 holo-(acyl-carrier-protein) synthase 1 [Halomonas sp. I3]